MKSAKALRVTAGISGSVLLVLAVVLGIRYRKDLQEYRHKLEQMNSQVIETSCGPIEYARAGSGYPVLVIHGNGGGFDQGMGLAQNYIGEGFDVISPSRFGYLRTPLPEGATVEMQADAYACLLDTLHIRQAAVFTSSAGVTSSVQFAMRHPDRVSALVLHSPNAPGKVEMQLPPKPVFNAMFHSDFAFWSLTFYARPMMRTFVGVPKGFVLNDAFETEADQALLSVMPASMRADGMLFDTFVSNPEINGYVFDRIQAPTLVLSAVDDPMALHENASDLAKRIPGAKLFAVSDGGHLMLGHTREVKQQISRFLTQVLGISGK
ncbi:MAG: alpha/beta fold hydrolase [Anaerolineaceae bacterium]